MTHRARHAFALALGIALGAAVTFAPRVVARDRRLPSHLPEGARLLLHERMGRHAEQMAALSRGVAVLDLEEVRALAEAIAGEPRLARPLGEEPALNAALPLRFFALQDALRERAHAVAQAAGAKDTAALAEAWSGLARACVECHAIYRDAK